MKKSKENTTVRQNSTYTATSKREVNLRRNPTLHFQVGLILALLASIFFIEMRTPEKVMAQSSLEILIDEVFTMGDIQVEQKIIEVEELKTKVKEPEQKPPTFLDKDPIITNEPDIKETLVDSSENKDDPMVDVGDVDYDTGVDTVIENPIILDLVEQVPLFPGCEGLSDNAERRACMSDNISKFVSKKFRTEKGEGLGLTGTSRIFVTFKIDKTGKVVDIKARAPHKKLEEEAKRVASLLPDMTAGKQGGKDVAVLFSLPISFQIQE